MLNVFPIQFLAPFAYMVLRVGLGFVLLFLTYTHIKYRKELVPILTLRFFPYGNFFTWYLITIEGTISLFLIIGLYTQIAALAAFFYALKFLLMHRYFHHERLLSRTSLTLVLFITLSLFITGAGVFAIDLPI